MNIYKFDTKRKRILLQFIPPKDIKAGIRIEMKKGFKTTDIYKYQTVYDLPREIKLQDILSIQIDGQLADQVIL